MSALINKYSIPFSITPVTAEPDLVLAGPCSEKNVWAPPGAADPIFLGKLATSFFNHHHLSVSCQFCIVTPICFLLKNWRPFFDLDCHFYSFHSGVAHYFRHVAMLQKNVPLLLWGPLLWGALFGRTCLNSPLCDREHLSCDSCLDNRREDYQNCTVLYFVPQLCTVISTPICLSLRLTAACWMCRTL